MTFMAQHRLSTLAMLLSSAVGITLRAQVPTSQPDWHHTALKSRKPDGEVLRLTIGNASKPNILERWWHSKRCRWLDESGNLKPGDLRGDAVNGLLQVDLNDDGFYDGPGDLTVRWCDTNGDGIPDVQAVIRTPKNWGKSSTTPGDHAEFMVMINHDQRGVLNWIDWSNFSFDCWGHTDICNWLPNYHGNNDFVKTHAPVHLITDPRISWENPFSFYDEDGDGVSEMTVRWCSPMMRHGEQTEIPPLVTQGWVSWDLDNNSGKGNETSYDMTIHGGGATIDISSMRHPLKNFAGNPVFDPAFYHNEWRRLTELIYMDRHEGDKRFFQTPFKYYYFTFDEDGDDHRWERVELMSPSVNFSPKGKKVDITSTARMGNTAGLIPGLSGHIQSDSLGDRGEFDLTGAGGGKLYIGRFDGKIHLYRANWGAWTVDKTAAYHGGAQEPTHHPSASKVEEVVKYSDTDGNGFIDTIEYDYDGDGKIDFKVSLLEGAKEATAPDVCELIDPGTLGWKGMHELFEQMAQNSYREALALYRAAWVRDLTTPELDKLAQASSMMDRYQKGYWLKEKLFRLMRERLAEKAAADASVKSRGNQWLENYANAYHQGRIEEAVRLISEMP